MADSINWIEKISEISEIYTTWIVEINGVRYIAKKFIINDKSKISEASEILRKELKSGEVLNSDEQKGICLYDRIIEDEDSFGVIRKYCEGVPLNEFLAKNRLQISESVNLLIQIARIVQCAHAHNIVHGNLKPSNIIVSKENISIVDWDSIVIIDLLKKSQLIKNQFVGTSDYMPIEQFKGVPIDVQFDVYALGIILYQILAGKTPFEGLNLNTPEDFAVYKGTHEPENISLKYSAIGIPEELSRIIENTVKNDRNQRVQNVSSLINQLQMIGRISSAKPKATVQKNVSDITKIESKIKEEHRLVLIGHTGAGKTVFATGLYATQDKDFSVDDPGAKSQTGIHSINTKTIIEEGRWPAATSIGDITRLRFKINYKKYEENISFDEYAGERLVMANYDKLILGNPDGAFILLNPGGVQWWDVREKNILISDLKYYIDLLSKMKTKPPIALVITASDRLESDLKDKAATFEKYINEIVIALERHHCKYKVFKVTVSGKLENQNKPHLNPLHIKDPFIWMIKHFIAQSRKKKIKRYLSIGCFFAAVLAAFAGGEFIREAYKNNSLKSEFWSTNSEYKNSNKSQDSILKYRNSLVELRNKACGQKHIANIARTGVCSSECKPFFVYPYFKSRNEELISKIEAKIDMANCDYFDCALNTALNKADKDNRKIVARINRWEPLDSKYIEKKNSFLSKAEKEMPIAIDRFDIKKLLGDLENIVNDPKITELPKNLISEHKRLLSLKTSLSPDEYQKSVDDLTKAYHSACVRVFGNAITIFNKDASELTLDLNDIVTLFSKLNELKNKSFVGIEKSEVEESISDIEEECYGRLNMFIDLAEDDFRKKILKKDKYESPIFGDDLEKKLFPMLADAKKDYYRQKINDSYSEIRKGWEKEKREEIGDVITSLGYKDVLDSLDGFMIFTEEHATHPFINDVIHYELDRVKKEIDKRFNDWDNSEVSYKNLNGLCAKIRNKLPEKYIKIFPDYRPYYNFSRNYANWWANDPKIQFRIDRIEVCSSCPDGAYISALSHGIYSYGTNQSREVTTMFDGKNGFSTAAIFHSSWENLSYFEPITVSCSPWEYVCISISPYMNIEWDIDRKLPKINIAFHPSYKTCYFNGPHDSGEVVTCEGVKMKFYFETKSPTIWDIKKGAGL